MKAVLVLLAACICAGCIEVNVSAVMPKEDKSPIRTEKRSMPPFSAVSMDGKGHLTLESGPAFVEVSTNSDSMSKVVTEVRGSTLYVGLKDEANPHDLNVVIRTPEIKAIETQGAVDATANIKHQRAVQISLAGASKLSIAGDTPKASVVCAGASEIDASQLKTKECNLEASGACNAAISASESASIAGSGACHIKVSGKPGRLSKDMTGACSIDVDGE